ncbi:ATP-binding cassette domain-containing protein [Candidatus Ozemobacteraceae bacterium]|nr:ATP-binding cassette domain-containing protein [Candidatus Ozemobacteraceae bacterium]
MQDQAPPLCIEARGLCRSFEVRLKAEGLKASIASFFRPRVETIDAVCGLEMLIEPGEIVGFLGPNGAGKTTTLKMLSGLIPPTGGAVRVLGFDPFRREHAFLQKISLVMGQKQNLWWDLPPAETLAIHRELYGLTASEFGERREELVEMLGIRDCLEVQARKLSLGQRMRCELAVSLLHRPGILFLDEPTIGLDILMQKRIRSFLLEYHARFRPTILLTSHYMEDVAALARRVIVINRGAKVFDGSLADLSKKTRADRILEVTFEAVPAGFLPDQYGRLLSTEGPRFTLIVPRDRAPAIAADLYSTGLVSDLTIQEPPLEEAISPLFS